MVLVKSLKLFLLGVALISIVFGVVIFLLGVGRFYVTASIFQQYPTFQGFVMAVLAYTQGSLVTAFGEELVFRGIILFFLLWCIFHVEFGYLNRENELKKALAALWCSILFALAHLVAVPSATEFLFTLTGGLLFAEAFYVSKNLFFPIGIHFGWNLLFGVFVTGNSHYLDGVGISSAILIPSTGILQCIVISLAAYGLYRVERSQNAKIDSVL